MLFLVTVLTACGGDPVSQERADAAGVSASDAPRGVLNAQDEHGSRQIAMLDDCDATDPAWAATGGCVLRGGAVTETEFGAFLVSALAASVVGHPAWRNDPSYLRVSAGKSIRVTNEGGRAHTFTPVAAFGGGLVPPLNFGLTAAPECVPPTGAPQIVPPGGRLELANLAAGDHRFQCCFHPWMRAVVKVE
jgi:plastocyanin